MTASRCLYRKQVSELLRLDPQWLIRKEEERYEKQIRRVAETLCSRSGRLLVLLCGPSAAGKTTTALKLENRLHCLGRNAYTVSLDNFFRGYGKAPQLPDGSFDYEAIEALNLPLLEQCMQQLLSDGKTALPTFDFLTHSPKEERTEFCVTEDAIVIFEGIHALHPLVRRHLPENQVFSLFINLMSPMMEGDTELLSNRDMRLVRRLLRDSRFRNSSVENTMDMWRQVVRGEELYMFPCVDKADVILDTTLAFETAMLGQELLPLLCEVPQSSIYYEAVQRLIRALCLRSAMKRE